MSCRVRPHSLLLLYQILTVDKTFLVERVGVLPESLQEQVDEVLRAVLYL
jgi:mRNA interferase MazF